jgi:hypothetical protein
MLAKMGDCVSSLFARVVSSLSNKRKRRRAALWALARHARALASAPRLFHHHRTAASISSQKAPATRGAVDKNN